MRITWIGGLTRDEAKLQRIATLAGHRLDFHTGDTGGRGAGALEHAIERADLVIVVTEVNSHNAVLLAKKVCQRLGRGAVVVRRCGAARFRQLLGALAARGERLRAAG